MSDPGNAPGWHMDDVLVSAIGASMANGTQGCAHCSAKIDVSCYEDLEAKLRKACRRGSVQWRWTSTIFIKRTLRATRDTGERS